MQNIVSLKVAYITEIVGIGGGETSLLNLIQSIAKNNQNPILICPEGKLYSKARELGLIAYPVEFSDMHLRFGLFPTFSLKTVYKIYRILKKNAINIVHAESLLGLYYGGMAARFCGIPCVTTYHGYWPLHSKVFRLFLNYFCKKVYPVSNSVATELIKNIKGIKDKIKTIPLGFNKVFLEELPSRIEARKIVGFPAERSIIMQVARFQAIKGHMNLLDAFEEIINRNNIEIPLLVFVGGVLEPATDEILEYKAMVENRVQHSPLRNHVIFLGHRNDIPILIRSADIIVSPSDKETFSMIIIEAMAVGTPVVATNAGGPGEILKDQVTGVLLPPRNPKYLAESILHMLTNKEWTRQLAEKAKAEAINKYSPSVRYKQLFSAYRELIYNFK